MKQNFQVDNSSATLETVDGIIYVKTEIWLHYYQGRLVPHISRLYTNGFIPVCSTVATFIVPPDLDCTAEEIEALDRSEEAMRAEYELKIREFAARREKLTKGSEA